MKKKRPNKLYSNENFPIPVVVELRKLSYDVLTIQETGKNEQALPDEDVLKFATESKRATLTFNRKHFIALHKQGINHAGIIVCTFDLDFKSLAKRIDQKLVNIDNVSGKLIRVNRAQI